MDPQQIRDALPSLNIDPSGFPTNLILILDAAAEYADLLETSEQVWWCALTHMAINKSGLLCRSDQVQNRPDVEYHQDCGWRLLTPTERQESMTTELEAPACIKCGGPTKLQWISCYTITYGSEGLYASCKRCDYHWRIKALDVGAS